MGFRDECARKCNGRQHLVPKITGIPRPVARYRQVVRLKALPVFLGLATAARLCPRRFVMKPSWPARHALMMLGGSTLQWMLRLAAVWGDRIALVLQGGGVLGPYQAGVYQALHEVDIEPDWVSGVSIGPINSAIIAGNSPKRRPDRLRTFRTASRTARSGASPPNGEVFRKARIATSSWMAMMHRQPGFFTISSPGACRLTAFAISPDITRR
jgi:Patatin-like phospholipase